MSDATVTKDTTIIDTKINHINYSFYPSLDDDFTIKFLDIVFFNLESANKFLHADPVVNSVMDSKEIDSISKDLLYIIYYENYRFEMDKEEFLCYVRKIIAFKDAYYQEELLNKLNNDEMWCLKNYNSKYFGPTIKQYYKFVKLENKETENV